MKCMYYMHWTWMYYMYCVTWTLNYNKICILTSVKYLHSICMILNHNGTCALNLMECIIYYIHIHVLNLYKIYTLNMMKRMHYTFELVRWITMNMHILNLSCIKLNSKKCVLLHAPNFALNYNDTLYRHIELDLSETCCNCIYWNISTVWVAFEARETKHRRQTWLGFVHAGLDSISSASAVTL